MSNNNATRQTSQDTAQLLRERLDGRIRDLQIDFAEAGVVLRGYAFTYYAKQLAQHTVMKDFDLAIVANEIEVRGLLTTTQ